VAATLRFSGIRGNRPELDVSVQYRSEADFTEMTQHLSALQIWIDATRTQFTVRNF